MADPPDDSFQPVTASRWQRIEHLVNAALERNPADRTAFLWQACAGDQKLYTEVQSLLACEGQEHPLFESGPWPAAGLFLSTQLQTPRRASLLDRGESLAGAQVDRFRIMRCLGRGGMGEVYLAQDTALGRDVALKFLALETPHNEALEQVTREARAASALNHPNIVTVHEVIRYQDTPVIVMERIEGNALRSLCGTPQPLTRLLHLGRQIAEALAAAHAHGIVHSDIKPENMFVRPDGYVKVLDFGLARPVGGTTLTSTDGLYGGTLRYMSPGQARGEPATPASDIFSFGLVLYELATGQHAFPSNSPFGALYAMLASEPAAAPLEHRLPAPLSALILSMLAKDPARRPSAAEVAGKLHEAAIPRRTVWRQPMSWTAALAGTLLAASAINWFLVAKRNAPEFANLNISPLTSQSGWEASPTLSADGQFIAFTWAGKLDGIRQLYVERLGGTGPVQLTHSQAGGNIGPIVWSPGGDRIAFERWSGSAGDIYSIARDGGKETKILHLQSANPSSTIDWSPDGTQLAFSQQPAGTNRLAAYLYDFRTNAIRKLTSPPPKDWGDWDPKFSPDGSTIAFKRVTSFWTDDIYLVPTAGGKPRRLTADQRGIWGHAWVPDGKSLVLSCQRGSTLFGLWRFPLARGLQPERITQGGIDAVTPATARHSRRLAWVNQLWDLNIYRASLAGSPAPVRIIASTSRDEGPAYSVDGRIAFSSDRSGSREVWLARPDGSDPVQLTHFNGPPLGRLQWSPDGGHLAFDSGLHGDSDIIMLDCDSGGMRCSEPHRLPTLTPAGAPSWSADGNFIYYAVDRAGRWDVWKRPVAGGTETQVTRKGGYTSHESLDGKWLYFTKPGMETIWRMPGPNCPVAGRPADSEEPVIGPPYRPQPEGWTITPHQIVFIDLARGENPPTIRAYDISSKQIRAILPLNEVFSDRGDIGVSVSSDSRWILYSQLDRSGSNVIVAENSR